MTDYEKSVIRNIIYAVETGGQVYGNMDYGDFTEAYTNSSTEYAITIGAAQWYGVNAQTLLKRIREADSTTFANLDTAGISSDLDSADWSTYQLSKTSAKAKCIVNIITTEVGKKTQDELIEKTMVEYAAHAAALGVTETDAQLMCANFEHQGGYSAVTRILAKTQTPYSLDNLYAACKTDTGNQVGAYTSRQKMVYESLKKYISNFEVTSETAIEAVIKIAQEEVGYLEKASLSNLDSKTENAGDGNYTKYWRDIYPSFQGSAWCACFVTWVFVQAFGKTKTKELLKHYPYTYVPTLAGLFTRYSNPQVGDIVMYYNGSEFYHTGIVIEVDGDKFITIEGNTGPNAGVEDNGDGVYQKTRYNSQLSGTKFARPDYDSVTEIYSGGSGESGYPTDSWTATGTATCTGDGVYIRETPGGTPLGTVSKGTSLEVDGTSSGSWVHVKSASLGVGYMHEDYVSYDSTTESDWKATGTATCTGNDVYVRKTAGGTAIGTLSKGNRFEVDGTKSGEWVHIKASGIGIGYMHEDYVSYDDSSMTNIQTAQMELNSRFSSGLSVDGIWGDESKKAYIKAIQTAFNSVYGTGLTIDGVWGDSTSAACSNHLLSRGSNNLCVGVLQIGLYAHNISLSNGIDCDFGESTEAGLITFQTESGLTADGIAGGDTFSALSEASSSGSSSWVTTGTCTCTGEGVYVRVSPGGATIGTVSKGTSMEIDGTRSGVWIHVKVEGIGIGYMHQNYVSTNSGSSTDTVQTAQTELNNRFNSGLTVDGLWGDSSKKALISAVQTALNNVYGAGLSVDGIWGNNTANACSEHLLSVGANNLYVGVLQIGLYAHGISLSNGIDCDFGASTQQGVMSFQNDVGLSADGIAGADTFKYLVQ